MQITEHIHGIKIPFEITLPNGVTLPRWVYLYLIVGERIYLIDTGVNGSQQNLFSYLDRLGRKPADIARIFLTHAHPDHVGAARTIQQTCGCPVSAHEDDRAWIEDIDRQFCERPVPGAAALVAGPVTVDETLAHGQRLTLEDHLHLQVYHAPGHSPGSLALFLEEDGALFVGDAIPRNGDLPIYDNYEASRQTVRRLIDIPNLRWLLSAWDDPKNNDAAYVAMRDGLVYLEMINAVILRCIEESGPQDPMALCPPLIAALKLPGAIPNPMLARTIRAHLCDAAGDAP